MLRVRQYICHLFTITQSRHALAQTHRPNSSLNLWNTRRMMTQQSDDAWKPFDDSISSIKIDGKEGGDEFRCDEEPHMLGFEVGHGYNPLMLGQLLDNGKYEIIRKLGWAVNSSVWLAKVSESVHDEFRLKA